jgi:hypothetical protein
VLIVASSAMTVFTGMTNVAELLFARELGAGASAFSALVAVWGAGFVAGSLAGAGDRPLPRVKRSYVIGLFVHAFAFLALSVVPALALAFVGFALAGYGNGVMLVSERVLTQRSVADALMARVFAANDTLNAWAFAVAFVAAGAMVSLLGTRETFAIAGAGGLVVWAVAAIALRDAWSERAPAARPAEPAAVPSRPTP